MVKRSDIVSTARGYLETRFRHQGRSAEGLDCAGLILVVAWDLGLSDFDISNYRRAPDEARFLEHFRGHMNQKSLRERGPGDVVIIRDAIFKCHCGIVAEQDGLETLIHAHGRWRKVLEQDISGVSLTHCFAYRGLED